MFSKEFFELLTEILKSWQVIVITVVLIIYMYIVSYVSRTHRRPMAVKKEKMSKKQKQAELASGPEETESAADSNEELGLEEA